MGAPEEMAGPDRDAAGVPRHATPRTGSHAARTRGLPTPRRLTILLATATLLVFALASTALGLGAAKTARPCPHGCEAFSRPRIALDMVCAGPAVVGLVALAITVTATLRGARRPWTAAVVGCPATILVVLWGSALLHVL